MKKPEQKDDFSDVEAALKKLRPVDLSARFYASVEAALGGTSRDESVAEEDFSDIEAALRTLRPVGLSERFYASVQSALDARDEESVPVGGNTAAFPQRGRSVAFPFRRLAASAAILLGAVGLGIWGFSVSPEKMTGGSVGTAVAELSALGAVSNVAVQGAAALPKKRRSRGDFRLVNTERRLNAVKPMDVVAQEDGSLARNVRYTYMDEYRWEDKDSGSAFVELRPHEELVSMEMSIY